MFNGTRLTFARKFRKKTLKALGELSGVALRTISGYENGADFNIRSETVEAIAKALNFPTQFFYEDDIDSIATEQVNFRALSKMSASDRDQNLCFGELAIIITRWMENYFTLPDVDVPIFGSELGYLNPNEDNGDTDIHNDNNNAEADTQYAPDVVIEGLADGLRSHWGLGLLPIKNMLNLVESKGVMVFSLPVSNPSTDGFSFWRDGRPFIFYNPNKTAERSRFDIAHELAHLVLHGFDDRQDIDSKNKEREANAFASAFLMPERGITANYSNYSTITSLLPIKQKWNVSLAALNYRLHSLTLISDWNYRTNCIAISKIGRTHEPFGQQPEIPQLIYKMIAALKAEGKTTQSIAAELHMNPFDLDTLLFGMLVHTERMPMRVVR